jgi:hypothetical protein
VVQNTQNKEVQGHIIRAQLEHQPTHGHQKKKKKKKEEKISKQESLSIGQSLSKIKN